MTQLFSRTKPNKADETIQRTKEKIIDLTKSLSDRQRYLKQLIDQLSVDDLQAFFRSSYQHVFYLFFENFSQIESNIPRAPSKQNQSDFEYVTNLLERILTLLPALVHQRWQAHCICNVIKKYFVAASSPQGVARGMRLFLLWYQILGSNAVEEEHTIFKGLIRNWSQPLVGTRAGGENNTIDEQPSTAALSELFRPPPDVFRNADVYPIWSKTASDYDPTVERWLFFMLHTISDTCKRVLWDSNRESSRIQKQQECFRFLFDMFKRYYMPTLFPTFIEQNIYDLSTSMTIPETVRIESDGLRRRQACLCRTAFVMWLLPFLNEEQNRDRTLTRVANPNVISQGVLTQSTASASTITGASDYSSYSNELYHIITGTSSKNQSTSLHQIVNMIGPLDSNTLEIGQSVLLSTQENINFIHEIFRQSYLMSGEYGLATSHILRTVNDWIKEKNLRPVFMLEPEQRSSSNDIPDDNHLRIGLNRWLQIFITQSFYLFLVRPISTHEEQPTQHGNNTTPSEAIIRERSLAGLVTFYKKLPQRHTPDRVTWDLILRVMLKIVRLSLQDRPPPNSNHLYIENTIKTLLFLFQSASLYVSVELWNNLSDTLSSKAMWPEVIDQWDLSMRALTKDLGHLVYKVETEPSISTSIRRGGATGGVRRTAQSVPPNSLDLNSSNTRRGRTLSSDEDIDPPEQSTPQQQQQPNRALMIEQHRGVRRRTNSDDSLTHSTATTSSSTINKPHLLVSIPSNQTGEQQATMEGTSIEQNSLLFSPSESLLSAQQQPLTIHIVQQTPNSHMGDMSSPNHALDSPMSDDYSTASTGVLDTNSLSGIGSGDMLTANFKNNNIHTNESRSTTVSESTSTSDHHQHISPPLSRDHHPLSQSTVDSLHSFPQDSATIDSIDTAVYMNEQNYESLRLAPETAYTAWFRMLGSLGNINQIRSSEQHNRIMKTLFDIWKMLCRIHVQSRDTQHGDLYFDGPPLLIFAPWLFEAIQTLPATHREGKLSAYRLLCSMGVFNHDVSPPADFLDMFLLTIYEGLSSGDEDIIYVIISSCKVDFFHRCWPSSTLLLPLFTAACCEIGQKPCLVEGKTIPKVEALTILSSLVCFPNHFEQLDVLSNKDKEKEYVPVTMDRTFLKRMIMRDLIKASQLDPMLESREIALCGLAIFLCEELKHQRMESPIKPFILFTVECLQPADSTMFAADILRFLASYAPLFMAHRDNLAGSLYTTIIDGLIASLRAIIPRDVGALMRNNVRIIKSLIFALLDWILHVPTSYLQQQQIIRDENNHEISTTVIQRTFAILVDLYRATNSLTDEQKVQDNELTLSQSIKLCCKFAILFLLNEHSHFPLTEDESSLITTNVHEGHDWINSSKHQNLSTEENPNVNQSDELIIHSANIQLFVIHDDFLISFIEIPNEKTNELTTDNQQFVSRTTLCRTIVRDLCGRYCWDNYAFNISSNSKAISRPFNNPIELILPSKSTHEVQETKRGITVLEKFDPEHPPTYQNQPPNADILDKLLQYITTHSPELAFYSDRTLTDVSPTPALISSHDEKAIMRMITEQETAEKNYDSSSFGKTEGRIENSTPSSRNDRFALCRSHITQLGLMMFENRQNIDLLNTSKTNCDQLLRELKNLDTLNCRETHKIAVIYIGYGQEDKTSIFNNTHGSANYEEFLAHLGWQVELSKHTGFRGGLHPLPNTYSIYYANALVEIMYHVATMIDGSTDEDRTRKKTRHIGNDEVQIIWTEHHHEYDRSIIASAFGDVLIVIHPLPNGLYRIKIDKTSQTTNFGPLFDGAIVDKLILPELVRATAINASRARRTTLNNHCEFYEERYRIINSIIRTHKKETTYEEFLAKSFTPLATKTLAHQTDENTKSTNPQTERRDGPSNNITNPSSNIPTSSQRTRPTARNFPFLTPNTNTVPTPITRR